MSDSSKVSSFSFVILSAVIWHDYVICNSHTGLLSSLTTLSYFFNFNFQSYIPASPCLALVSHRFHFRTVRLPTKDRGEFLDISSVPGVIEAGCREILGLILDR